ncbi:MAG: STAS domain-containing protein [Actinomycetota bacterium]|nr:STAS domain-containing protein [Actinomycetota bacterium]
MSFGRRSGPNTGNRRKERAVDLVIGNAVTPRDVPRLCARVRALLERDRTIVCDVAALAEPDLGTVDALARLQLTVKRLGGSIELRGATRHLEELVALAGLEEVLPLCPELGVQPVGQAEEREEPLGVEEEADPGDLSPGYRQDL